MGRKVEEKNEIVEEFFRQNNPKDIKSMQDMYTAWRNFFGPAFQKLLDAEMETKLGYAKNERTDNNNYRNGYYPERTVSTEMGDLQVKEIFGCNISPDMISDITDKIIPEIQEWQKEN